MNDEINSRDSAFVNNDLLYNKEIKAAPKPETNIGVDTNGTFYENIYRAAINNVLDVSSLNSFNAASLTRDQIYALIDTMAEDSTIAAALELYTEGATETNDNGLIVWCESNDSDIAKEVQFLLDSMNIDKLAYSHMHSLIKYGDLYIRLYRNSDYKDDDLFKTKEEKKERAVLNEEKLKLEEDIKIKAYSKNDHYSHYIERQPNPAELFELTKLGKSYAYIKTDVNPTYNIPVGTAMLSGAFATNMYRFHQLDIYIYEATNFVHACLDDTSSRTPEEVSIFMEKEREEDPDVTINYKVRRGKSLLYDIFKIWRTLKLIENAVLLNRVTKSSIVRVVGVEVGDMPKEMVGPHLQGIKSMMEQKAAIDTGKGISEYTNPGPVENNIYVPTRDGKGAISTTLIGGDADVSKMADLDYFKNLFYGALGIPKLYMGDTEDGAGFNGGQSLSIISSTFAKRVKRFLNAYCQCLTDAVNLMLLDAGLDSYVNQFTVRMQAPTTQEEETRTAEIANQMGLVNDIMTLLTDIQDITVKLSIVKELLADIITNPEVIQILQDYIDKLEAEQLDSDATDEDNFSDEDMDLNLNLEDNESPASNYDLGNPNDLDSMLGLESTEEETITAEVPETEISLPSPSELGIGDLTNNNNPEI